MTSLVFAIFAIICGVRSMFVTIPDNIAVIEGARITLKCRADPDKIRWFKDKIIYTGDRLANNSQSLYSFNDEHKELLIKSSETLHAGKYICEDVDADNTSSAEIIILEKKPACSVVSTGDGHLLSCNVSFKGNWAPVMEWRMENITEPINGPNVYHKTTPNDSVISVLTLNSSLTVPRYTCTTRFIPDMRPPTTNATNVPNYTYTWTSPELHGTYSSAIGVEQDNDQYSQYWIFILVAVLVGIPIIFMMIFLCKRCKIMECMTRKSVSTVPDAEIYDEVPQHVCYADEEYDGGECEDPQPQNEYAACSAFYVNSKSASNGNLFENVGADGTVYSEVNVERGNCLAIASRGCPDRPNKGGYPSSSKADIYYAPIDHTICVPYAHER